MTKLFQVLLVNSSKVMGKQFKQVVDGNDGKQFEL